MYGPDVAILLTYGSHDERDVYFCGLTVVNETPLFWGVTEDFPKNCLGEWSNCETPENPDFLRKDKTIISVKIQNFSRSRMTKRTSPFESSREI